MLYWLSKEGEEEEEGAAGSCSSTSLQSNTTNTHILSCHVWMICVLVVKSRVSKVTITACYVFFSMLAALANWLTTLLQIPGRFSHQYSNEKDV